MVKARYFLKSLLPILIIAFGVRVSNPHRAVFSSAKELMRDDTTNTGFFTNISLFDSAFDEIEYHTEQGIVVVKNEGGQNFLACRYNPATKKPIWIATGGGKGGDGGCNYYTVPPENAVYVIGYFEGTAYFPRTPGSLWSDTIVSHGGADLFIAKYSYDKGILQWISSGGSQNTDIVFTDNIGTRHKETLMTVDSANVTVYANFFGPAVFGRKSIDAKLSGSAVQICYNKESGDVADIEFPTALPAISKK